MTTSKVEAAGSALFGLLFIQSRVVRPIDDALERAHQTNLTGFELLLRLGESSRRRLGALPVRPGRDQPEPRLARGRGPGAAGAARARRLGARRPALAGTADRGRPDRAGGDAEATFLEAVREHLADRLTVAQINAVTKVAQALGAPHC